MSDNLSSAPKSYWDKALYVAIFLVVVALILLFSSPSDERSKADIPAGYFTIFTSPSEAKISIPNPTGTEDHLLGMSNEATLTAKDLLRREPTPDELRTGWSVEVSLEKPGFKSQTVVVTKNLVTNGVVPPVSDQAYTLSPNYGSFAYLSYLYGEKTLAVWLLVAGLLALGPILYSLRNEKLFLLKLKAAVDKAGDDPFVGKKISDYQLWEAIGKGGYGRVYRSTTGRKGQTYALKVMPYDTVEPQFMEDCKARFVREMEILGRLHHPNIMEIIDFGHTNNYDWCVMPLYDGGDLATAIEEGTLTPEQILLFAQQMADGLQTAHDQTVIHRDMKPANVMISGGQAILIDFGLAKDKQSQKLTQTHQGLGTPIYMPPEQAMGTFTEAGDQYAYGTVLFEMLAKITAFEQHSRIGAILNDKYMMDMTKRVTELLPDHSDEIRQVLVKMMDVEAGRRYPSIKEAYQAFEKAYKAWMT